MAKHLLAIAVAVIASSASAATLTVTPDAMTYQVGDTITLSIFGDPEGGQTNGIFGRLLFDGDLATHIESSQTAIITDLGVPFVLGSLQSGDGFADAFNQVTSGSNLEFIVTPLVATVVLQADSAGLLQYDWNPPDAPLANFEFFDVLDPPTGSVRIIPEPSTTILIALGLVGVATRRRLGKSR